MESNKYLPCSLQDFGHVLNFTQLKLGVHAWRREGIFTAGHVLDVGNDGFDFEADDGVLHLFHHRPHGIQAAVATYGTEAVLLEQGVFVVLGARQDVIFNGNATFNVATADRLVGCRTDHRPGDNSGPVIC